jgi:peptidoglycan/xylan/chitin deacetylase (PgdA/CDA1 family)
MRLLIVNYHYIRDVKPNAGIYPLSTVDFQSQVEVLGKHYRFTSQEQLFSMIDADSFPDENLCLLTFDDSLAEQWCALDVLARLSIPALCFATTDSIVNRRAHDVHKLHYVFSRIPETRLLALLDHEYGIAEQPIDQAVLDKEYRYDSPGMRRVKFFLNYRMSDDDRRLAVDRLFAELEPDERKFSDALYMTSEQLVTLARSGMLGTHSRTHRPLSILAPEDMRDEIAGSKRILEEVTGSPIQSISYPYGGPAAVSQTVAGVARDAGIRLGLTMFRGMNDEGDLRDGLMLKRVDTNDAPGGKLRSNQYVP